MMTANDIVACLRAIRSDIDKHIRKLTHGENPTPVAPKVGCQYLLSNGRTAIATNVDDDDGEIAGSDEYGEVYWWKRDGSPGHLTEDVPVKLLAELKTVEESK